MLQTYYRSDILSLDWTSSFVLILGMKNEERRGYESIKSSYYCIKVKRWLFFPNSEKILLKLGIPKKVGMEETPRPKHLICYIRYGE